MNILAHVYLAGDDPHLVLGNFIADHVKGKAISNFPPRIQQGIMMHRKIDFFTDHHPQTEKTKQRLRPRFHKYAPVISDMYYDHFLASQWNLHSDIPLQKFAADFYNFIGNYHELLPERTRNMIPFLIKHNWIMAYASIEGLHSVLSSMAKRAAFISGMENAASALEDDYDLYKDEFNIFFPELKEFADLLLAEIGTADN